MIVPETALPERKVPVIVRPSYTVFLERTSGLTFVHCDVHSAWTPKTKAALLRDWSNLLALHEAPILALHDPGDLKHEKFLRMFGFTRLTSFKDTSGSEREIHTTGA
jgi:hypothetical protein